MADIPAAAVRAVAEILRAREADSSGEGDIAPVAEFDAEALELLLAAAPFLAEHIAKVITANVRNPDHSRQDRGKWVTFPTSMAYVDGHDNAARLAREAFPQPPGTLQDASESSPGISGRSDDPKAVEGLSAPLILTIHNGDASEIAPTGLRFRTTATATPITEETTDGS